MENVLQDHRIRYVVVGWQVGFLMLHGTKKVQK